MKPNCLDHIDIKDWVKDKSYTCADDYLSWCYLDGKLYRCLTTDNEGNRPDATSSAPYWMEYVETETSQLGRIEQKLDRVIQWQTDLRERIDSLLNGDELTQALEESCSPE